MRPKPRVTYVTGTTISLEWDEPTLPESCDSVAFSFPPLTYAVYVTVFFLRGPELVVSVLSLCEVYICYIYI